MSTGLLVRTFYFMLRSNAGFSPTRVITFELPLPSLKYSDTDRMAQVYRQVLEHVRAVPGIEAAVFASVVPLGGERDGTVIRIPEHPRPAGAPSPLANYSFASPDYFRAIGTPLLRGRGFSDHDTLNATPVTIINSAMAKKYWPGEDPVGKQVGVGLTKYRARVIVGVIGDIKHDSLREEPSPEMIVPYTQNEIKTWPSMQTMQYAVRTKMEPAAIGDSLRGALHEVDPDLPMAKFTTLTTLVNDSLAADRLAMTLIGSFGVMALILVAIGMFGVISYSVAQRTREIGLRVALGAKRTEIFTMVMGQAARLACVGIGIGVVAALATTRLMARFLYGVQPTDPLTFSAVSLLLLAVALLACYIPARKAIRVDPMIALRYE